jgi:hypothetical protein
MRGKLTKTLPVGELQRKERHLRVLALAFGLWYSVELRCIVNVSETLTVTCDKARNIIIYGRDVKTEVDVQHTQYKT